MLKSLIRLFFKTVRRVLGPFLLLWERLTTPRGIVRGAEAQARLDALTRNLVLYQYRTCPFCMKVRKALARLSLQVERRDAQHDPESRRELELQGGRIKVPCLRITAADGSRRWLYESAAIIRHLEELADSTASATPARAA
jgi:glutaredoxin